MSKIIKIIYVYLLNTLNLNKILVTRNEGIKSTSLYSLIITIIISLIYGYGIYMFALQYKDISPSYVLAIGFFFASTFCLFMNIRPIKEQIIQNKDRELLGVLPLTNNQILCSKMFFIYIKNIIYCFVIMGALLIAYGSNNEITETFGLMYFIISLIIPLLPIVIVITAIVMLMYVKSKVSRLVYYLICFGLLLLIGIGLYYGIGNIDIKDSNFVYMLYDKLCYVYPLILIFRSAILENYLSFLVLLFIPILFMYLYTVILANNYEKLVYLNDSDSRLIRKKCKLKKRFKFNSLVSKELKQLLGDNKERKQYIIFPYLICFVLLIVSMFVMKTDYEKYIDIINYFVPILMLCNMGLVVSTLDTISNEKDSIKFLETLPISRWKIFLSKIVSNVIIGIPILFIQFIVVKLILKLEIGFVLVSLILSFIVLMLMSVLGLVIDLKFYDVNDNGMKLSKMIPSFIVMIILVTSIFLFNTPYLYKEIYLFTYGVILLLLLLFFTISLFLFSKRWVKRIMN